MFNEMFNCPIVSNKKVHNRTQLETRVVSKLPSLLPPPLRNNKKVVSFNTVFYFVHVPTVLPGLPLLSFFLINVDRKSRVTLSLVKQFIRDLS